MLCKTKVELCWVQESLLLCKLLFKYINMDFANVFIARGNHYLQVKLLMPTLFALTEQTLITLHTTFTLHSPVLLNEIACETIVDIIELLSRYPLGSSRGLAQKLAKPTNSKLLPCQPQSLPSTVFPQIIHAHSKLLSFICIFEMSYCCISCREGRTKKVHCSGTVAELKLN